MGPMDSGSPLDKYDTSLQEAREEFGEAWDIYRLFGTYVAVPKGTPLIQGMFVSTVIEKLRARS